MTANYKQPDVMNKRVRFYDGQFLQDQDFIDEQKYHLDRQQRATRLLRVAGIADGLEARTTSQPFQVRVTAGTAVDADGRLVVLAANKTILDNDGRPLLANAAEPVALPPEAAGSTRWLYIAYHQMPDNLQASGDGVEGETRWHEAPYLFTAVAPVGEDDTYDGPPWHDFLADGPPAPVLLARLTLDANGAVTIDSSGRRYSGLRLPGLRGGNQAVGLRAEGDGRVGLWLLKDGDLVEHLSVTEKGFVGVGSPAPNAALEIRTELKATVQNRTLVGLRVSPNYNANNISGVREYGLLVERGSVGIGTAEPIQALDVNGRIHVNNGVIQRGGTAITNTSDLGLYSQVSGSWMRFVTNNGHIRFYTDNGSGTTHKLTIEANGNVGIGTDTPPQKLTVSGGNIQLDGAQKLFFSDADVSNNLKIQLWSGYGLGINGGTLFYAANGRHSWRDNNGANERMSLTTGADGGLTVSGTGNSSIAGNLGIGTTSPTAKLEISASATTAGGWLEAIRFSRSEHSAITHPGGGLLFGMHSDRNFYFGDIQGGTIRKYVMILNANNGSLTVNGNLLLDGNNNITTRRGLLFMGTTDGSAASSGEVVGALGFLGYGVQHGQLSFRVGHGFEMVDRSPDGPSLNYNRDSYGYADLKIRSLHLGDWTVSSDANHLYIKRGSYTIARFSITRDRFQVYRNRNGTSPYFYYNEDGNSGN